MASRECVSREMWREPEDRVAWRVSVVRCGGSQRTVWPGESVSREMWREPEDRVAWRVCQS